MPKVERTDWYFLVPATTIWSLMLVLTAWDFIFVQGGFAVLAWARFGAVPFNFGGLFTRDQQENIEEKLFIYSDKKNQKQLVTNGVYRFIRHPICLAAILYVPGCPLIFSSLYGFLVALAFIPCIMYRIEIEEKLLIEEFGEQYIDYMKHTKKLLPYIY